MTARLGAVTLPNPVLTASGCAAAGRELDQFFDVSALGAVVTKSIMQRPRSGRPTPRMAETPSGMLNSIGLQGPGVDAFIANELAWLEERGARAVVSIAGGHTDEFVGLARRLSGHPAVSMLEVNISCPNVENRGQVFACDAIASSRVVSAVRRAADPAVPVFAKLSPDVTDIVHIARACADAGGGRAVPHQHAARHGDRRRPDGARARRGDRRTVRPGDPAGRGALRLAGPRRAAAPADPRDGRHPHRARRAAVRAGRGVGGVGRDGGVRRPVRAGHGCWPNWSRRWPSGGSRRWRTPWGTRTSRSRPAAGRRPVRSR